MERDLIKFNKNITKVTKEIAKYEDEKGNYMLIPTGQLLCNVEYMELDEISYKKALFEMIIDKNAEYYKVTTFVTIDFPVINLSFTIPIQGETRKIERINT